MKYVYILENHDSEHFYVRVTDDVPARLAKHNAGEVAHTSKYRPWRLKTYVAFSDEKQAFAFEKYLKSGSGRAFAKKRLRRLRHPQRTYSPSAAFKRSRRATSSSVMPTSAVTEHAEAGQDGLGTARAFSRRACPRAVSATGT
jgi:putative endonuclease